MLWWYRCCDHGGQMCGAQGPDWFRRDSRRLRPSHLPVIPWQGFTCARMLTRVHTGTESGVVRLWDFTGAAAAAERAAASRAARTSARAARAARQGHSQQHQHQPHHSHHPQQHHHTHGMQATMAVPLQQQHQPSPGAASRGWGSSGSTLPGLGVFGGSPSPDKAAAASGPASPAPVTAAGGSAQPHVGQPPAAAVGRGGGKGGGAATSSSNAQEAGRKSAAQRPLPAPQQPQQPPPQQQLVHRARNSQRSGGAVAPPPPPPQLPPAFRYVSTGGGAGQGAAGAGPGAGGQRQLRHLGRQRTGGAVGAGGGGAQQQQRPAEAIQAVQPGAGVAAMPGLKGGSVEVPAAALVAQEGTCGGEAEGGRQRNGGPGCGWSHRSSRGRSKGGGGGGSSGRKGEQRRVAAVAAVVE